MRAEDGPMQFGDDWPGIFLRGDTACISGMQLKMAIEAIEKGERPGPFEMMAIKSLADILTSCDTRGNPEPQMLPPFTDLVKSDG